MSKRGIFRNKIIYGPENPEQKFYNRGPDDEELKQREAKQAEINKGVLLPENKGKKVLDKLNGKRIFSDAEVADIINNNPETDLSKENSSSSLAYEIAEPEESIKKYGNEFGALDELPNKGSMRRQERFRTHNAKYDGDDGGRDTETDYYKNLRSRLPNADTLNSKTKAMKQRRRYKKDGTPKGEVHNDVLLGKDKQLARDMKECKDAESYDSF